MMQAMPLCPVVVNHNSNNEMIDKLTELESDDQQERQGWSLISIPSLNRIWDNDQDAAYDEWKTLYINA